MQNPPVKSVLVVDDDPVVCAIAESYFLESGATETAIAYNGKEAADAVEQRGCPFDFILLDLKMPVMDGVQFLRHMYERSYKGAIGIASGENAATLSLATNLARKQGLNVVGQITKPLDRTRLGTLVSGPWPSQKTSSTSTSTALSARDLEIALSGGQIKAHYQPQCCASTGRLLGIEALARWCHPELGMLAPYHFISLAEDNDLMPALTHQMMANIVADMEGFNAIDPDLTISINLGAGVLNDTSFPDVVTSLFDQSGGDRSRLILELTESKLIEDSVNSLEVLARLDLAGFELSIDDFGTQFSNIDQLTKSPFKELKVDRQFVHLAASDERSRATVQSCVSLGKELGMRIVAEGVETAEDWRCVASLGVHVIQGYLIAKPAPIDTLMSWAKSYQPIKYCEPAVV